MTCFYTINNANDAHGICGAHVAHDTYEFYAIYDTNDIFCTHYNHDLQVHV